MGQKDPHLGLHALVWSFLLGYGLWRVTCYPSEVRLQRDYDFWFVHHLLSSPGTPALREAKCHRRGLQGRRGPNGKELMSPANCHQAPETCQQPHQWTWEHVVCPQSNLEMTVALASILNQTFKRVWTKGIQTSYAWTPDPQKWSFVTLQALLLYTDTFWHNLLCDNKWLIESPWVCFALEHQKNEIKQYIFFCAWLHLFNVCKIHSCRVDQ